MWITCTVAACQNWSPPIHTDPRRANVIGDFSHGTLTFTCDCQLVKDLSYTERIPPDLKKLPGVIRRRLTTTRIIPTSGTILRQTYGRTVANLPAPVTGTMVLFTRGMGRPPTAVWRPGARHPIDKSRFATRVMRGSNAGHGRGPQQFVGKAKSCIMISLKTAA